MFVLVEGFYIKKREESKESEREREKRNGYGLVNKVKMKTAQSFLLFFLLFYECPIIITMTEKNDLSNTGVSG